jgi:hypothetical protein
VIPHLEFFPINAQGRNIFKLSQSKVWLESLSQTQRVQMCTSNNKHYYIFEPVKLKALPNIVVPIFFFKLNDRLFSKCIKPHISLSDFNDNLDDLLIHIPSDIKFQDPNLSTLPLEEFDLIYSEIKTKNGKKLLAQCGNCMKGL